MTDPINGIAQTSVNPGPYQVTRCDDGAWMVHTEGDIIAYAGQGNEESKARAICAVMNTAPAQAPLGRVIKDISDDALFHIATEAWLVETDKSWSSDGLEAAVRAVRSAVEEAPPMVSSTEPSQSPRERALERAALDFVHKVDRGGSA